MRKFLLASMAALAVPGVLWAQAQAATETAAEVNARAEALAKQAQNPVADMVSLPVQFNWTTGGGLGEETQQIINIQPVLPLAITDDWLLISRTIVPMVNLPGPGGERIKGIADVQEQIYLTPKNAKGVVWGVGPVFSFPTSTNVATETGQFGLGPSVVLLKVGKKWVYGLVANQLWRIAGSTETEAINAFFVQPFINYNLKRGWAISTAPAITANWDAPSDQQWTVPLGIGVSKVTRVGKQPLNVILQYYHNVERPDAAGEDLVRMQFTLLYPTAGR